MCPVSLLRGWQRGGGALTWLKPFLDLGFCLFTTSVRFSVRASVLKSEGQGGSGPPMSLPPPSPPAPTSTSLSPTSTSLSPTPPPGPLPPLPCLTSLSSSLPYPCPTPPPGPPTRGPTPTPSPNSSCCRQALLRLTEVQTFSMLLQRLRPLMAPWEGSRATLFEPQAPGAWCLQLQTCQPQGAACHQHTQAALSPSLQSASFFTKSPPTPINTLQTPGGAARPLVWSRASQVTGWNSAPSSPPAQNPGPCAP